ncbi:MAG TPA: SDR family NAD(P)-dependent oxidoreductase [Smithella sp.]|nr:SDR family oxidoreductase [Smithella sp.]MDM7987577.1 SDR family NAD(P)-dependent oxidoreductase [Smithella sp.]HNY51557.1 SDR family NAD(P)-dependent oxidoreductase [Smithella sp.]HOG90569.1 SDR family NAD(P)-dependent oxidoreductase [Smithella sp.]HOU50421.1 SDR family NAD(P)-dependent oxidoreductase [Smithella sp.]
MPERLNGKSAIITGASNGIGRATAILFAREGANLVLADVNESGLQQVAEEIKDMGGNVIIRKTDVSSEVEIKALIQLAVEKFTHIDILVNNAGIGGGLDALENQTAEEWHRVYDINVMGPVYATKHIISHMKERRKGSIINIASIAGLLSGAGGNAYSASKAALINFTKTAACEVGSFNVRINAICPGLIETAMTQPFFDWARSTGKENQIGKYCELKRAAAPEEVAWAILFLATDEASYMTGQAIPVDGGITASMSVPGRKI